MSEKFYRDRLALRPTDEIERLQNQLKEADTAIRELQQEACNRAGVPMPSQRPVVDRQRDEIERLRAALAECVAELESMGVSEAMTFMEQARAVLAKPEDRT